MLSVCVGPKAITLSGFHCNNVGGRKCLLNWTSRLLQPGAKKNLNFWIFFLHSISGYGTSTNIGFRLDFEPKIRPIPKDVMIPSLFVQVYVYEFVWVYSSSFESIRARSGLFEFIQVYLSLDWTMSSLNPKDSGRNFFCFWVRSVRLILCIPAFLLTGYN
jgi:hypothetical protein